MSGAATGLDHVGVAVPDLDAAAAEWAALGFTVQPLAAHMDNGMPTGTTVQGVPTGTGNRNIMLREGYIELLANIDPARPSATIARFIAHHIGAHVLTLAIGDEDAALARLGRAGFSTGIARSARPADPASPQGPQASFARIPLADADPRLQLLRHLTPELVWQERFLSHPNRARALRAVIVAADPPAGFAARLARAAGVPVVPDPHGGLALRLAGGVVRVLAPDAAARLLPGAAARLLPGAVIPALPAMLGLVVQTDDVNAAVAAQLGLAGTGKLVGYASGVAVLFTA